MTMAFRKRVLLALCLPISIFLAAAGAAADQELSSGSKFSLRFSGALSRLPEGDLKTWFDGEAAQARYLGGLPGFRAQWDASFSRTAFEPGIELQWNIRPWLALGLRASYLRKTWRPGSTIDYDYGGGLGSDSLRQSSKRTASLIPLTISASLRVPAGNRLSARLKAGLGWGLAGLRLEQETIHSWPAAPDRPGYEYSSTTLFRGSGSGLVGTLGASLELALARRWGIVLEVFYRTARIDRLEGDLSLEERTVWQGHRDSASDHAEGQTLWFGRSSFADTFADLAAVAREAPEWLANPRPFELRFDGVVLKAGLSWRLF